MVATDSKTSNPQTDSPVATTCRQCKKPFERAPWDDGFCSIHCGEAFYATEVQIQCPACSGAGKGWDVYGDGSEHFVTCPDCGGSGKVWTDEPEAMSPREYADWNHTDKERNQ